MTKRLKHTSANYEVCLGVVRCISETATLTPCTRLLRCLPLQENPRRLKPKHGALGPFHPWDPKHGLGGWIEKTVKLFK